MIITMMSSPSWPLLGSIAEAGCSLAGYMMCCNIPIAMYHNDNNNDNRSNSNSNDNNNDDNYDNDNNNNWPTG